ncbi:MAG: diaminopimelate epimerase [Rhizomicrobium sp.]
MTPFLKMHGLGNDFVVFDARKQALALDEAAARAVADRRRGIGCDQVIVIRPGTGGADATMEIRNPDGSEAEQCGNATRCVARLLMAETGKAELRIDTRGGPLVCTDAGSGMVTVDFGAAKHDWADVPLAKPMNTEALTLVLHDAEHRGTEVSGMALSMGNPHFVSFVPNAEVAPVIELGSAIERHPFFPKRTNVEFVSVLAPGRLRMRVWERGAGVTLACGSGACAAAAAAYRRGLVGREMDIQLDGGVLHFQIREGDEHILMTGPSAFVFQGEIDLKALAA